MPPHCDTRDGPVVKACERALETGNPNFALIWVPKSAEPELRSAFERVLRSRELGGDAKSIAEDWFFETAVRLHRAGEGAPYAGLKPSGLSEGPVVPRAEKSIETGNGKDAIGFILDTVEEDLQRRFNHVLETKNYDVNDVEAGRAFVAAFIDYVVWSHHLFMYVKEGGEYGEEMEERAEPEASRSLERIMADDHDRLDAIWARADELKELDTSKSITLFREFVRGLEVHIEVEEKMLFPYCLKAFGEEFKGPVEVMIYEHRQMQTPLKAIESALASGKVPEDQDEVELKNLLLPHNVKEEGKIYPWFDDEFTKEKGTDLAREVLAKLTSSTPPGRSPGRQ